MCTHCVLYTLHSPRASTPTSNLQEGEGAEVGLREELEEDVIVKDVCKGSRGEVVTGEVVIGKKVSVRDDENREGRTV